MVDLWGGHRMPNDEAPWNEDTMVVVASMTKGLDALDAGADQESALAVVAAAQVTGDSSGHRCN